MPYEVQNKMSDSVKFGAILPAALHHQMHKEKAERKVKLKLVYEQAVAVWVTDVDGVALDLLNAYYAGPEGLRRELRSVLDEYRQQHKAAEGKDLDIDSTLTRRRHSKAS